MPIWEAIWPTTCFDFLGAMKHNQYTTDRPRRRFIAMTKGPHPWPQQNCGPLWTRCRTHGHSHGQDTQGRNAITSMGAWPVAPDSQWMAQSAASCGQRTASPGKSHSGTDSWCDWPREHPEVVQLEVEEPWGPHRAGLCLAACGGSPSSQRARCSCLAPSNQ